MSLFFRTCRILDCAIWLIEEALRRLSDFCGSRIFKRNFALWILRIAGSLSLHAGLCPRRTGFAYAVLLIRHMSAARKFHLRRALAASGIAVRLRLKRKFLWALIAKAAKNVSGLAAPLAS